MNKSLILDQLKNRVQEELEKAQSSSERSRKLTSENDMKQEGKYDTRAIEAGYLAGAQQKRVEELKLELKLLEEINLGDSKTIEIGSLVQLKLNEKSQSYFLCTTAGGTLLNIEGNTVLVISVFSPLGSEILGLEQGESFVFEGPKGNREYEIEQVV